MVFMVMFLLACLVMGLIIHFGQKYIFFPTDEKDREFLEIEKNKNRGVK